MLDRNEVLKNYSNLVARLWEDDTLLERLKAQPRGVLSNFGFDIPEDAEINLIIREMKVDGSPTTQADMWAKGEETGVYDFIIPLKPEGVDDLQDVPLEDEVLEIVAGGLALCCPCCCPCCDSAEVA